MKWGRSSRRYGMTSRSAGTPNESDVRRSSLLAFLLALIAGPVLVPACGGGGGGDVGKGAERGSASGDAKPAMQPPTEAITFYSHPFEGDGFFFVIDRSEEMQDSGELDKAKRELIRVIKEFSPEVEFGVVFFAGESSTQEEIAVKFPANGRATKATPAMKAAAVNWVQSVPRGRGSCCQQGLLEGLKIANSSSILRRTVIYVGDGSGDCGGADEQVYLEQTIRSIRSYNYQRVQFSAIGVGEIGATQDTFLKSLATGGPISELSDGIPEHEQIRSRHLLGGTYVKSN